MVRNSIPYIKAKYKQVTGAARSPSPLSSSLFAIGSVLFQIPRAIYLRNRMFFTGTAWTSVGGLLILAGHLPVQMRVALTSMSVLYSALLMRLELWCRHKRSISRVDLNFIGGI